MDPAQRLRDNFTLKRQATVKTDSPPREKTATHKLERVVTCHTSRLAFSDLASRPSLFSTHCRSCVSRKRHCPPTLKAGSCPLRIIRCSVRVETCKRIAASERVSKRMFSRSIENFLRQAKRNANASKNLHLTDCFRKGSATEVGALQVQKWTTRDKPRLASAVAEQLGKNCTSSSMSRALKGVIVDPDKLRLRMTY